MTDIFDEELMVGDYVWFTSGNRGTLGMGLVRKFSTTPHKWRPDTITYKIHLQDLLHDTAVCLEEASNSCWRIRKATQDDIAAYQAFESREWN